MGVKFRRLLKMFGSYQGIASAMPQSPKEQWRLQALRENGTGNAEASG